MRLIDADELIKDRVENDPVRIATICAPTAYDLDKVLKQLEERRDNVVRSISLNSQSDDLGGEIQYAKNRYNSMIEIVKSGIREGEEKC